MVRGRNTIGDSLVVCRLNTGGTSYGDWAELVNAATGWDTTPEEMQTIVRRIVNLARLFNVRHGLTAEMEYPSARYGSAPLDGPNLGKTITPVWKETLTRYYELMGWDRETGNLSRRPSPAWGYRKISFSGITALLGWSFLPK